MPLKSGAVVERPAADRERGQRHDVIAPVTEEIVIGATFRVIPARAQNDEVAAIAADETVIARSTREIVVPGSAIYDIAEDAAFYEVIAREAVQDAASGVGAAGRW